MEHISTTLQICQQVLLLCFRWIGQSRSVYGRCSLDSQERLPSPVIWDIDPGANTKTRCALRHGQAQQRQTFAVQNSFKPKWAMLGAQKTEGFHYQNRSQKPSSLKLLQLFLGFFFSRRFDWLLCLEANVEWTRSLRFPSVSGVGAHPRGKGAGGSEEPPAPRCQRVGCIMARDLVKQNRVVKRAKSRTEV